MKRKIAILLATTMTLSAVPTFAAKTKAPALEGNVATVANGAIISSLPSKYKDLNVTVADKTGVQDYQSALKAREGVLKIGLDKLSTEEIKKGDTFTIQLENGKFDNVGQQDPAKYAYRNVMLDSDGTTVKVMYVENGELKGGMATSFADNEFSTLMTAFEPTFKLGEQDKVVAALPHIPYSITIKDETTAEIKFLSDITDLDITKENTKFASFYENNTDKGATAFKKGGKVDGYLAIPLGEVESTGGEELKVRISGFSNTITDGTVTVAKTVGSGSTRIDTSYITKKIFEFDLDTSDLYVRENTKNSFENDREITIRLSSGFEFKEGTSAFSVKGVGTNVDIRDKEVTMSEDKTKITFKLENTDSTKIENIRIALPDIRPINEDKNYGEVSLTISGSGVTTETVVIAERQKLGFKLETKTEVPTITKGRYVDLNSNLSSKESTSAEFEFSELVPASLLEGRSVDFTVPSGVKIVDAKVVSYSGIGFKVDTDDAFSIINDGTTLRLERNKFTAPSGNNTGRLRLQLKLSVDAGFTGEEVKLSVVGGGISEALETVIAKVQNPFTITATSKNINIGYQDYSVNDIVITETQPGMFMEGGNLNLSIAAPYGTSEMGFTNAKVKVTGGNLEIKPQTGTDYLNRTNNNNQISINIKTQSTKEPATITISDVKIGTTRSVPYGAYNLKIDGSAVINNNLLNSNNEYVTGVNDDTVKSVNLNLDGKSISAKDKAKRIDVENGSYQVQGYVNVVTATDTIDKEMKVTIGNTTAIVDGKEVTMDVAPYIQANGNTMVPLRFVAVALAGGDATSVEAAQNSDKISWDATTKTITIFYGAGINQKIIQFKIGSTAMIVDGNTIPMENGAKAEIKDGRTFVPFRSLGQALGVPVSWDATSKTAIFNQR